MSDFKNYREESRKNWGTRGESDSPEQIQLGAILRIADATEMMAQNFRELQDRNTRLKESLDFWKKYALEKDRKITALKGAITRLKKRRTDP